MKRLLDVAAGVFGLLLGSIILIPAMIAVWLQDWHSPFYIASRAGVGGTPFRMVKLRSMKIFADATGVMSTAAGDPRITWVGRFVRRWKLDELTQLWNVLRGDMSLVGPRPQVMQDVALYTAEERRLLTVRPGITDMASIVFADEGEILRGAADPDLRYNQLIRPWKSRLALLYVDKKPSIGTDLQLVWLTVMNSLSRERALPAVAAIAHRLGGGDELARVALRRAPLQDAPPPGASEVFRKD
jgi:lipopolysaccharide/colanic/teichoic acid biosynthesis glycosyltransferase